MRDRKVLVTGATGGIGRITAEALARQGAEVVLVGRDPQRTQATSEEIQRATGNEAVSFLLADLSSLADVKALAERYAAKHSRLDVLLHNAGAIYQDREVTVDGFERTFATNHLAPFLLTHLLRPLLEESASARVVTVASEAARFGRFHFDDLMCERRYGAYRAYNQSKLANIAFSIELAERLRGTRVTSNSLHPGIIATGFGRNREGWVKRMIQLGGFIMSSPEKGAETSIYLASSPEVEGVTGGYFIRKRKRHPPHAATVEANRKRLWAESEKCVGI